MSVGGSWRLCQSWQPQHRQPHRTHCANQNASLVPSGGAALVLRCSLTEAEDRAKICTVTCRASDVSFP